jgi:hypothetical protein
MECCSSVSNSPLPALAGRVQPQLSRFTRVSSFRQQLCLKWLLKCNRLLREDFMSGFGNVCKRTLVVLLLSLGATLFVPVPALANGVITVITPLDGVVVTVPFEVHFTYSGTDTYTKLWIDGVAIISDHNGSTFD